MTFLWSHSPTPPFLEILEIFIPPESWHFFGQSNLFISVFALKFSSDNFFAHYYYFCSISEQKKSGKNNEQLRQKKSFKVLFLLMDCCALNFFLIVSSNVLQIGTALELFALPWAPLKNMRKNGFLFCLLTKESSNKKHGHKKVSNIFSIFTYYCCFCGMKGPVPKWMKTDKKHFEKTCINCTFGIFSTCQLPRHLTFETPSWAPFGRNKDSFLLDKDLKIHIWIWLY